MLGSIPVLGGVFTFIGGVLCKVLSGPPELVIGTLKSGIVLLFGGSCPI